MIASFLITLREVIEASLIVATMLGILVKLKQTKSIRTVWQATLAASTVSVLLLIAGSLFGVKVREVYSGKVEEFIEGILMALSALFITWAVFFLHRFFAGYKTRLLSQMTQTMKREERRGIFWLAFTAVFREGFEIVLFLSTIFFSSHPQAIFTGFFGGLIGGLLISFGLFTAAIRLPVRLAFRMTSMLLILFAAGLFARGIHEFAEAGIMPEFARVTLSFIPAKTTLVGDLIKAVFGITRTMDIVQIAVYTVYVAFMSWYVFGKRDKYLGAGLRKDPKN